MFGSRGFWTALRTTLRMILALLAFALVVFAVVALLLAIAGVYGVLVIAPMYFLESRFPAENPPPEATRASGRIAG